MPSDFSRRVRRIEWEMVLTADRLRRVRMLMLPAPLDINHSNQSCLHAVLCSESDWSGLNSWWSDMWDLGWKATTNSRILLRRGRFEMWW